MAEKLAIAGGSPVCSEKWPTWPSFEKSTIRQAMEPLRTGKVNYWTGTKGMEFEQKFAEWCGANYGISTANGTTALHVALSALGVGPGDEVLCTSYSFIASSMCVAQAGAVPVFSDVRREDHTLDPAQLEAKITPKTRAIVPVHLYGNVCDMDPIMAVARKHKLFVVEDCAQAHGATYKGKKVGTIGCAGAFSFCQSKTFTTGGEGGCVITNDENVAWEARSVRDHGYDVKERLRLLELEAKLPYIHNRIGYNFRMTEVQSVIGLCELARIDSWNLANRRRNGEYLNARLKRVREILYLPPHKNGVVENGFWVYPVVFDIDRLNCSVRQIIDALVAEGIPAGPVMWPQSYKERCYRERRGFGRHNYPFGDPNTSPASVQYDKVLCENAAWLEDRTVTLYTLHPVYKLKHMRMVVKAVKKVVANYRK
ncbi:MAG: DegT/DnrJ/EryC1/StrS family aminotransferase [Planctomycetota bacterium]